MNEYTRRNTPDVIDSHEDITRYDVRPPLDPESVKAMSGSAESVLNGPNGPEILKTIRYYIKHDCVARLIVFGMDYCLRFFEMYQGYRYRLPARTP